MTSSRKTMAAAAAATVAESILVVRSSSSAPRGLHVLAATGPGKTLGEIGGTGGTKRARVRSSSSSPLAFPVVDGMRLARATPTRTSRPSLEHARSALTLTSESGRARLPAAATGVVARVGGQRRRWAHTQAAARVREDDDEHRDDGAQLQQQHNGLGRLSAPTTAAPSATSTLSSSTLHHPSTTTSSAAPAQGSVASSTPTPLSRYDDLVARGLLRDDAHQRQIIERLQAMHEQLVAYHPPAVPEKVTRRAGRGGGLLGGLGRWFGGGGASGGGGAAVHGLAKLDDVPKGMYLYGDVGTGKTMLMDLFYDTLPPHLHAHRRRVHFHAFMLDVFRRVHAIKHASEAAAGPLAGRSDERAVGVERLTSGGLFARASSSSAMDEEDAIYEAAREMASEGRILCFDEFQVTDIVTAMILRQLLERMMAYGVVCVMTSNRHPDDLYKNGIQRTSFEPCIELIKRRFDVVDLDSGTDYRRIPRALSQTYFSPLNTATRREMQKLFEGVTAGTRQEARRQGAAPHDPVVRGRQLTIWGRKITVPESTSKVARFTFEELCGRPLSSADYIEITQTFGTIFVEEVARMGLSEKDMARRFITFVDACYESKTRLFISSEVPIFEIFSDSSSSSPSAADVSDHMRSIMDDLGLGMDVKASSLFTGQEELFAFARCVSRLVQMGTKEWQDGAAGRA